MQKNMQDPQRIGKYTILERIGRGGMGFVYKAIDPILKREVALKCMLRDLSGDEELRNRFSREAQSAGGLRHPNIVTIYDLGTDEFGSPFIAMEFLTGTDLEQIVKNHVDLELARKLDIIIQTCKGLGYAHSKGIIHRDIKPANIRLLENGDVKILDFGIAKIAASHFTRTGMVMGTPHYMSPEQIRGEKVDGRTDIFSLGVVLYELLSFRKPFAGDNPTAVLFKIIHSEPDPLVRDNFEAPEGLEKVVLRALAKKAEDRYQSCEEFGRHLHSIYRPLIKSGEIRIDAGTVAPTLLLSQAGAAEPTALLKPASRQIPTSEPATARVNRTDLPPISPTPIPSTMKRWLLLGSSGVLGIVFLTVLLFSVVKNVITNPEPVKPSSPPQTLSREVPKETQPPALQLPLPAAAPAVSGWLSLNIQPWAEIKELRNAKGETLTPSSLLTPCKIALQEGKYSITLTNSQFKPLVIQVEIKGNQTTTINGKMEGFHYAKAVDSLGL
jgi:serine/threonine-protein kinase